MIARRSRFNGVLVFALLGVAMACRGQSPRQAEEGMLRHLVDSLRGRVEQATKLTFRTPPRSALRTREQVRR